MPAEMGNAPDGESASMLSALRGRVAQALELARGAGADDAWASASRSRGVSIELRDGEIEKLQESTSRRLALRLYVAGRYATFQTSDLREKPLRSFVHDAVAMTRALEVDPFRVIPDPALFEDRSAVDLDLTDDAVISLTPDQRLQWCRQIAARMRHDRIVSATVGASDSHTLGVSASSNGFSGHHERTSHWRGGTVTLQDEGDARPADRYWTGARHLEEVPSPEEIGDEALRRAVRRLGATQGQTRRTTMVVEPRAAGRLIGLLLGPASARAFSQERSFWRGHLSERAVSEHLSIADEPLLIRGLGSRYYDGEGISSKRLPIVEAGALTHLFVDTYYGRKVGRAPTTGGSSNLVVAPGARDLEAIVADVDSGCLITSWLGGNSDSTTGDFSLGVRGHRIEAGKVGAPIQEMNITGNLLSLFANLVEVGNDPWPFGSRRVPTLVFDGVQFSGA